MITIASIYIIAVALGLSLGVSGLWRSKRGTLRGVRLKDFLGLESTRKTLWFGMVIGVIDAIIILIVGAAAGLFAAPFFATPFPPSPSFVIEATTLGAFGLSSCGLLMGAASSGFLAPEVLERRDVAHAVKETVVPILMVLFVPAMLFLQVGWLTLLGTTVCDWQPWIHGVVAFIVACVMTMSINWFSKRGNPPREGIFEGDPHNYLKAHICAWSLFTLLIVIDVLVSC